MIGVSALCVGAWLASSHAIAQTPQVSSPSQTPEAPLAAASANAPATGGATQQGEAASATGAPAVKAFEIEVVAPDSVRELIERHNELQRYQAISDLEGVELERLLILSERNLRELLGTQGYFSPRIRITRKGAPGERPTIVMDIEPGEPTVIGKVVIDFQGDIAQSSDAGTVEQRDEIRSDWKLPSGRRFTQDSWSSAKTDALRLLVARRYPAGKIGYSLADVDPAADLAHLQVQLDSGPLYRLGAMRVTGTQRYDPVLVQRLARLQPGDIYDQRKLNDAQYRLTSSGYYDSATVFIDPEDNPEAVPVQVQVTEAKLQKVVLGGGFSTNGGPRLGLEYRHNRVPGIGWRAITKMQIEKTHSYLQTDWQGIPAENGWRWGAIAKIDRLDDNELTTVSQQLRFGRSRSDDRFDRNLYVQLDRAQVNARDGAQLTDARAGDGSALSVNYIWTARYFDSLPSPSRGYGLGAELGGGYTLEGVRKPFLRGVARWLGILPLGEGANASRLSLRAEGGAVVANSGARVPSALLFRTGGDTTVRGYAYRAIGIDYPDDVIGPGRYMAVGSIEWQRPILREGLPSGLEHTIFLDFGDVAEKPKDLHPRFGIGTGVRLKTPVGPMQLDLAYGLKTRKVRLHLSVGFVF
ncbi:autotransporter assembly complex protein TamA [Ottowia thiooxydans]|uniref:autotransporter assembly complex protein TamA n=1 Tax=Ottowia thiooxydans TaxID=219182 RepID=UPI00040E3272|nr:BamA/TamA family outer membrane protein [Ottowia thiooxydans]